MYRYTYILKFMYINLSLFSFNMSYINLIFKLFDDKKQFRRKEEKKFFPVPTFSIYQFPHVAVKNF